MRIDIANWNGSRVAVWLSVVRARWHWRHATSLISSDSSQGLEGMMHRGVLRLVKLAQVRAQSHALHLLFGQVINPHTKTKYDV